MSEPCANHSAKNRECERPATPGHIYCKPCRLATGGYDRYNPPAVSNRNTKQQQQAGVSNGIRQ
jgi:hypothetical protein